MGDSVQLEPPSDLLLKINHLNHQYPAQQYENRTLQKKCDKTMAVSNSVPKSDQQG